MMIKFSEIKLEKLTNCPKMAKIKVATRTARRVYWNLANVIETSVFECSAGHLLANYVAAIPAPSEGNRLEIFENQLFEILRLDCSHGTQAHLFSFGSSLREDGRIKTGFSEFVIQD